jgi:competence protein ComEA
MPRATVAGSGANDAPTASTVNDPAAALVVHVAGAVARPGVYRLAAAARVADAIDAAGGAAPDADLDGLNLAAKVGDGERVYVPRRGEVVAPGPGLSAGTNAPAVPLDLNTATAEQLDDLPGVGPATAEAIVSYRTEHGRFRSVEQLLEVRGIGEAKLAAIRSKVRVR